MVQLDDTNLRYLIAGIWVWCGAGHGDVIVDEVSVLENVILGVDVASEETAEEACKALLFREFVKDLVERYDMAFGSEGSRGRCTIGGRSRV
jgi:ABC-type multidrug transport system fused ATPase/permease subunit